MAAYWDEGYAAKWSMTRIDEDTWEGFEEVPRIKSIRVERDCTDDVPMLESGEVAVTVGADEEVPDGWYRIGMSAFGERTDLATMWFTSGDREYGFIEDTVAMVGRSSLYPASSRKFLDGSYAPKGADGAAYAAQLISECTPAPVHVEGSFTLSDHVVFDLGSSRLQGAWAVLKAAGWCIRIDARGEVHVGPKPSEPSLVLDEAGASALLPGMTSKGVDEIPNVYVAVSGSLKAEAVNADPSSKTSTVSRGFRVEEFDQSPTRLDGETLYAYAQRRLLEERTVVREFSYTREFRPDVHPFSLVTGTLPKSGVSGNLRVRTQSIDCSRGILVEEVVGLEDVM